jgi:hypothetical protein
MWLQFTDKEWPKVISVLSAANLLKVDLNGLNETMPSQARKTCNILGTPVEFYFTSAWGQAEF